LHDIPKVPEGFNKRKQSDRYDLGTGATLIKNATIWTGNQNGIEIVRGDILLDKGIVKAIGEIPPSALSQITSLTTVLANGAWVTPALGKTGTVCFEPFPV
jgi:hypothetical protein